MGDLLGPSSIFHIIKLGKEYIDDGKRIYLKITTASGF